MSRARSLGVWLALAISVTSLWGLARAVVAQADADPASDTLLIARVFYPYDPTVSPQLQTQLNALTAALAKKGLPVRVALIESPTDLGAVPTLYGHAQTYAAFLDREITVEGHSGQPLLTVMADGYGTASLPAGSSAAVAKLPVPGKSGSNASDTLAAAAISTLTRLAAADGITVQAPAALSGGGGGVIVMIAGVVVVLVVGGTGALLLRRRRRAVTTTGGV